MMMKARVRPNTTGSSTDRLGVCARAAPAKAPINACEDEEGSPHHQVNKFQTMAPNKVANMTLYVTADIATPFAIEADTCDGNTMNATKLKNAAHATAACGDKTRVDTMVA